MKVVLLAGGLGTRISEESVFKPKPMIEIGGKPILWHIMKIFSAYGHNEFIICAGYKQHMIKEWFANYYLYNSDVTFDFANNNNVVIHSNSTERWNVTIVDTGLYTMTGGRIKRVQKYIGKEAFFMTYGDGVSDVNLEELLLFHKKNRGCVTLTAIQPEGRFGSLDIDGTSVKCFLEKNKGDGGWINGGFMVMEPSVFEYIDNDSVMLEREPMERLAKEGLLKCYKHEGFWQCMDTMRDKEKLEDLLSSNAAPWQIWKL